MLFGGICRINTLDQKYILNIEYNSLKKVPIISNKLTFKFLIQIYIPLESIFIRIYIQSIRIYIHSIYI